MALDGDSQLLALSIATQANSYSLLLKFSPQTQQLAQPVGFHICERGTSWLQFILQSPVAQTQAAAGRATICLDVVGHHLGSVISG